MKVAMIGHKVVPSRRGGIENVLTSLCPLLAESGVDVTCYNRSSDKVENEYVDTVVDNKYQGVTLKKAWTIEARGISAMISSFTAAISATFAGFDVLHFHAEGPCAAMWIPKMFGKRCVATVHGLDWQREKWGKSFASKYIKFGERVMVKCADEIIVLSESAKDYFKQIYNTDISAIDNVKRNPKWTQALLKSYARNIATLVKQKTILEDVKSNADTISLETLTTYIDALERLHIIEDIDAWCPSIRSKSVIRASKKRMFTDPSIAVAAMGLSPTYFNTDLKTFGFLFECLCIRDLKVYSSALGGEISYYHDRYGLEADAVLHLDDGRYALIEFKLGAKEIEEGSKHLLKIKELVKEYNKTEKQCPLREPDLLIIITSTDIAYTRNDGVKIIPIGCLKD